VIPIASVSLPGPEVRSSGLRAFGRFAHQPDSGHRLQRADENAAGAFVRFGHEVQALVHSVYEVDICAARRAEQNARPGSQTAGRVGGLIVETQIGFRLYDPAGGRTVNEELAEQIARHLNGRPAVEAARYDYCVRNKPFNRQPIPPVD